MEVTNKDAFGLINSHYVDEAVITDLTKIFKDLINCRALIHDYNACLNKVEKHILKDFKPELKAAGKNVHIAYWSAIMSHRHLTEAIADVEHFLNLCSEGRGQNAE